MIEDKIARVKILIQKRDEIDSELASIFGMTETKRGRPRKDQGNGVVPDAGEKPSPDVAEPGTTSTDSA